MEAGLCHTETVLLPSMVQARNSLFTFKQHEYNH